MEPSRQKAKQTTEARHGKGYWKELSEQSLQAARDRGEKFGFQNPERLRKALETKKRRKEAHEISSQDKEHQDRVGS